MPLDLGGKRALVTGSSRGIGRAIAETLRAEGCRLALNARTAAGADVPGDSVFIAGDMTDPQAARRVVDEAVRALGGLDILVANVGSGKSVAPGSESPEEWQRVFGLNLWSATNAVEAARDHLAASRGAIACVSSICGQEVIPGAPVTYSAAKAALNAYVRGIARPLGKMGIRINAVAPGNVLFDGSGWARRAADDPAATAAMLDREVALAAFGDTASVADVVAYLVSSRARFVTGAVWVVDGGQVRS